MPITPAEASRLAPTWRAPGKVISAMAAPPRSPMSTIAVRERTRGLRLDAPGLQVVRDVDRVPRDHALGQARDQRAPPARSGRRSAARALAWRTVPMIGRSLPASPATPTAGRSSGRATAPATVRGLDAWSQQWMPRVRGPAQHGARHTQCTMSAPRTAQPEPAWRSGRPRAPSASVRSSVTRAGPPS